MAYAALGSRRQTAVPRRIRCAVDCPAHAVSAAAAPFPFHVSSTAALFVLVCACGCLCLWLCACASVSVRPLPTHTQLRAISTGKASQVKACHAMRGALELLDFEDASINDMKRMLLQVGFVMCV